jgi:neutral ceramidase
MKNPSRSGFHKLALGAPALLAVAAFSVMLPAQDAPAPAKQPVQAGFAERDITPALGMEQPGGYGKAFHTEVHDPCKVRVSVFDDGVKRVAFVGIDALMVSRDLVQRCREGIEKACGIPGANVMIGASHSHSSGPTGMVQPGEYDHADDFVKDLAYNQSSAADPAYLKTVEEAIIGAVVAADKDKVPAKMGFGRGHEDKVGFNRRMRMKNGQSWSHPGIGNPDIIDYAGPIDPEVGVIAAWNMEDKLLGVMVNYSCHCTTNPGGISANWVQYLEQVLQGGLASKTPVVFLQGASGDITQVDNLSKTRQLGGEDMSRYVGGRVGAEALKVVLSMPKGTDVPLDAKQKIWQSGRRIPAPETVANAMAILKNEKEASAAQKTFAKETVMLDAAVKHSPTVEVEVQALQVGPAVFVSNPAEYFVENGLRIKKESKFPFTWSVELANGCTGYVPTEEAFRPDGGGYETRLTSYSNLEVKAGTKMAEAGITLTHEMVPGVVPTFPAPAPFKQPWAYGNNAPEIK